MHMRLTDFIDNIALDPELVARNLYARLENDILREMCRRKKVKLGKDTARELVGDLVKVKSITKNAISLLSPWQIVTYSKELFGQQFVGLRSKKKKTSRTIIRKEVKQAELRKIMDLHPNWGRKQLYKAMAQKFKGISQHLVNDMLYDMGFWETPKSPSVIRWKDWIKKFEHITWAGDFFCVQVFTEHGPKTYYVLFFIHLESDLLFVAGISPTATAEWVKNTIKRWTEPIDNPLNPFGPDARFLIRDRDRRYTKEVDWYIA